MTHRPPIETTNLDRYGHTTIPWERALGELDAGPLQPDVPGGEFFVVLGTVRPDGRPHAVGIGARWVDGQFYFTSGLGTRKSRNLASNPNCTLVVRLPSLDLTLEGTAERIGDPATLERLAALYREDGWPAVVEGDAFAAPFSAASAGPSPWHLYRLVAHTGIGIATAEPSGATRWRFVR